MANRLMLSHVVGESLIHVIDPVSEQALRHIIDLLGYTNLFKENLFISTDFKKYSKTSDKAKSGMARVNRVLAKLNPNVDPASIKWEGSGTTIDLGNGNTLIQNSAGRNSQRRPWADGMHYSKSKFSIMHDDEFGIDLTDRTVGSSLSMEVTMEFLDEHMANEAISRISQVFTNGDKINYLDIAYDVPIPAPIQNVLRYLYHLRSTTNENPDGAFTLVDGKHKRFKMGEWYHWLQMKSNNVITCNEHRDRPQDHELVINKNHFQALYLLECNQETPAALDPDGASVTFNLTVQYARSNRIVLEYPVIVNNQYVDPKFVPMERQMRAAGPETQIMWDNPAVAKEWLRTYTKYWPPKPFMFPYWDPWLVPSDSRPWLNDYRPVLVAAFTLDNTDDPEGVTKFDFDTDVADALGCKLDDKIMECLHEKKNKVLNVDEFVNLTVYADDIAVDNKYLDFSDGHTLIIKNRRTVPIYRMVLSIGPKINQAVYNCNRVWIVSITALRKQPQKEE